MSYQKAMEAAGAEVICFEQFGSYQGEWLAKVAYQGKVFWVNGSYGSCSGCDAFEAEFDYKDMDDPVKLAEFGVKYLTDPMTQADIVKQVSRNLEWDSDAQPMLDFVNENAIPSGPIRTIPT